jgi:serine/threonine protein kinase
MSALYAEEPPTLELAPGSRFGNYEIVRKLGEGGMGAVYEARRQGLNKRVALKVLTLGGNAAVTARFVQEARISASLEHPNVADCFDVGEHEGVPFLALEFLDGETLGARMDRGPLDVAEITDLMLPVCSALLLAHGQGVVHRDLKPDNIFLARQAGAVVPKVLDFGIAKARTGADHQGLTRTASIMGTPNYMSPEQAKDSKNVGPATDQFALGVILWESVTGRALFTGESSLEVLMHVVSDAVPRLGTVRPGTEPGFEALVATLLEKDAALRFPSMREAGLGLLPFASPGARARWEQELLNAPVTVVAPIAPSTPDAPSLPTLRDRPPWAPAPVRPGPNTLSPADAASPRDEPPARRGRRAAIAVGAALLVGVLGLSVWRSTRSELAPDARPGVTTGVAPLAAPTPSVIDRPPTPVSPTPTGAAAPVLAPGAPTAHPAPAPTLQGPRGLHGGRARRGPRGRRRRPVD